MRIGPQTGEFVQEMEDFFGKIQLTRLNWVCHR